MLWYLGLGLIIIFNDSGRKFFVEHAWLDTVVDHHRKFDRRGRLLNFTLIVIVNSDSNSKNTTDWYGLDSGVLAARAEIDRLCVPLLNFFSCINNGELDQREML